METSELLFSSPSVHCKPRLGYFHFSQDTDFLSSVILAAQFCDTIFGLQELLQFVVVCVQDEKDGSGGGRNGDLLNGVQFQLC